TPRPAAGSKGLTRRWLGVAVAVVLGGQVLAACSSGNGGTPTLNFYLYPDNSGAVQAAVDNCTAASGGRYQIKYQKLPTGADGQRQQMVRRMAAEDSSI